MKNFIFQKNNYVFINLFFIALFVFLLYSPYKTFAQSQVKHICSSDHTDDHSNLRQRRNYGQDSIVHIVNQLNRGNGQGEAIIIQRHRDDPAADRWVNEYVRTSKKNLEYSVNKQDKSSSCNNLDFEEGNFNNWLGQTGINNGYPAGSWVNGIVAGRHTIVTGGTDPWGGFPMLAPNGGSFSVKLGNDDYNYEAEQLIYTFVVQPSDTNFIYKYAVVLEDPAHSYIEQPYFEMKISDGTNTIIPCSYQQYVAGGGIPGFQSNGDVRWKGWTTVGINLSGYVGQTITIIVTSADCSQGAHFGYGYIDFICPSSFSVTQNVFCDNVTSANITVPDIDPGMLYHWSTGQTTPSITINPQLYDGTSVNCFIESPTSVGLCGFWYVFPISVVQYNPDFSYVQNCLQVDFTDASTINSGTLTWLWDFGDGTTSTSQNPSHTYSTTGTFNVTLTINTAGCGPKNITQTVTTTGTSLSVSSTNLMCAGANNGTATVTASGGSPPYNYSWSTSPPQNTSVATNLSAGVYTVTVSDNGSCSNTASVTITEPNTLQTTITPTPVSCYGGNNGSIVLTCNGGTSPYTIIWSNGQSGLNATGLVAGPYNVTISDSQGCSTVQSATVTQPAQISITASASPANICQGSTSTLSAANASTYVWSPSSSLSSSTGTSVTATPLSTTTYYVTGTDASSCTAIAQVTVTVSPPPSVSITGTPTICAGQTSVLSGNGATSYVWNTTEVSNSISVSPAATTTYSVVGTNASGCTGTATYTVTVIPMPVANAGSDAAVCQLSYNLQAIPSVGTGIWSVISGPGNVSFSNINLATATMTVGVSGTYTLVWTENNGNGCTDADTVVIQLTQVPTSAFTLSDIDCSGDAATVTYTGTGTALCTYTWNFFGGNAVPGTGAGPHSVTWMTTGPQSVNLTVSLNGCSSTPTTQVTDNPTQLTSTIVATNILCYNQLSGAVNLTPSGGTPPYTFIWSNQANTEDLNGVGDGIYSVVIRDQNGCTATNGATVLEPAEFHVSTNPNHSICYGQTDYLNVSVTGGTGPTYTYLWSTFQNTPSIAVNPLSNTTYSVTATDQNGCPAIASVTVYVSPPINVTLVQNADSVCPGEPVMLTPVITGGVGPPYTIINQDGTVVTPPIYVYPNQSGYYSVYVEDACGTHDTGLVYIFVHQLPPAAAQADSLAGCQPFTVHFNELYPDDGRTYVWDFGDNENLSLAHNPVHTFTSAGIFTVTLTVTSVHGCRNVVQYPDLITVYPKPNAQFTWSPEFASVIKPIVTFNNLSTNASSYIWTFGDGDSSSIMNPVHRFPNAGSWPVELIAVSNMGCKDTVMYPVEIQEEYTFYAPTAFSPDYNQDNDFFYAIAHGIKETGFYLAVYDRWGEVIWDTDKYSKETEISDKWDGRAKNNAMVPVGTYTWFAKFKDYKGNDHEKTGAITVIR